MAKQIALTILLNITGIITKSLALTSDSQNINRLVIKCSLLANIAQLSGLCLGGYETHVHPQIQERTRKLIVSDEVNEAQILVDTYEMAISHNKENQTITISLGKLPRDIINAINEFIAGGEFDIEVRKSFMSLPQTIQLTPRQLDISKVILKKLLNGEEVIISPEMQQKLLENQTLELETANIKEIIE